jgi:hypothetical protein
MNIFKEYYNYLQDNPEGYWFKRKLFGWATSHSVSDTLRPFLIQTAILSIFLIVLCYKKGESPRWQWHLPKNEPENIK